MSRGVVFFLLSGVRARDFLVFFAGYIGLPFSLSSSSIAAAAVVVSVVVDLSVVMLAPERFALVVGVVFLTPYIDTRIGQRRRGGKSPCCQVQVSLPCQHDDREVNKSTTTTATTKRKPSHKTKKRRKKDRYLYCTTAENTNKQQTSREPTTAMGYELNRTAPKNNGLGRCCNSTIVFVIVDCCCC